MTTVRPTKKQRELLDYIESFIAEHGYSPSYREIMNGLSYNSVATVALHIGNLIKRGHLRKRDHSARSLEVVRDAVVSGPDDDFGAVAGSTGGSDGSHEDWLVARIERYLQHSGTAADGDVLLQALELLGLSEQAANLQLSLAGAGIDGPQVVPAPTEVRQVNENGV